MAENEILDDPNGKKIRRFISVPFIWEEKPGTPKKDWKPSVPQMKKPDIVIPLKPLVASVPFQWEEKPGKPKPLPWFSQLPQAAADIISPPSPPGYSEDDNSITDGDDGVDVFNNDEQEDDMSVVEMEPGDIESEYDSFSSAPSLLANGLISSFAISRAVPVEVQTFWNDGTNNGGELRESAPSLPASEAESSASSYATGTTSLTGPSFLERLFPALLAPDPSFPGKVGSSQEKSDDTDPTPKLPTHEDFDRESYYRVVARRPPVTLGELIMMSRRMSYHRKAIQTMKPNPSMEFMKKNAFGCGIFGPTNGFGQLNQKWKRQFQLKIT